MLYCIALFITIATSLRLDEVHEVIIIGAGIAGIGASKTLTLAEIPHLILESRGRIGGRIHGVYFQGVYVDFGAATIHSQSNNALNLIMKDMGWRAIIAENKAEHFFYQRTGQLDKDTELTATSVHQKLLQRVVHNAFAAPSDLSVKAAGKDFLDSMRQAPRVKDTVKWLEQIQGNIQGADLSQLSARQVQISDGGVDYTPQGGFQKLLYAVYQQCESDLRLRQKVTDIDYSQDIIIVNTNKNTYKTKRLISSLPLGVLKAGIVQFTPPLPEKYTQIINKIGVGNMNKLYVSFSHKFWGDNTGWLNFVTKDTNKNRYPIAQVIPSKDKHILCFFLAGKGGNQIHLLSKQAIIRDITQNLQHFFAKAKIQVLNLSLTKWDSSPHSMGSYSFYKVGTTMEDIIQLRQPIDKKIWFIGEHTHPRYASMTHGAFQTGQWAAQEVITSLLDQEKYN